MTLKLSSSDANIAEDDSTVEIKANWVKGKTPEPKPLPDIKAAVSIEETSVTVDRYGSNVSVNYTVTLSKEDGDRGYTFKVAASGGNEEAYSLNAKYVYVAKGSKSANGTITFDKNYFQDAETEMTVTITVSSEDVTVDPATVQITASALPQEVLGTLSVESNNVEIDGEDKPVTFTVTLSQPLDKDAVFTVTANGGGDKYILNDETVTVAKGSVTATGTITFLGDKFVFNTDNANVALKISSDDVRILDNNNTVMIGAATKPITAKARLLMDVTDYTLDGADLPVSFTIAFTEPIKRDAVFTVNAAGTPSEAFEFNDTEITIPAGETSVTGTVTLKAGYLVDESKTVSIDISATCPLVRFNFGETNINITAKGKVTKLEDKFMMCQFPDINLDFRTGVNPSAARVALYTTTSDYLSLPKDIYIKFEVYLNGQPAERGVYWDYTDDEWDNRSNVVLVESGYSFNYCYIKVLEPAIGKTLDVIFSSDYLDFVPGQNAIHIRVLDR